MPQLRTAIAKVERWDWVRPRMVLGAAQPRAEGMTALSDLDGLAHAAYGVDGTPALILIRPDGHIAFRGHAEKPELLCIYCERIFGSVPTSTLAR